MIQALSNATNEARTIPSGDVELTRLLELVRLRAAQLLGCTDVITCHASKLRDLGETIARIGQVYWWSESTLYTEKERTAFALCEALAIFDQAQFAETLIAESRQDLTDEEILGIVIAVSAIFDWTQAERALQDVPEAA